MNKVIACGGVTEHIFVNGKLICSKLQLFTWSRVLYVYPTSIAMTGVYHTWLKVHSFARENLASFTTPFCVLHRTEGKVIRRAIKNGILLLHISHDTCRRDEVYNSFFDLKFILLFEHAFTLSQWNYANEYHTTWLDYEYMCACLA